MRLWLWPVTVGVYVSRARLRGQAGRVPCGTVDAKPGRYLYAGPWTRRVFNRREFGIPTRGPGRKGMVPGGMVRLPELATLVTPGALPWFRVDAVGWERGGKVVVHLS